MIRLRLPVLPLCALCALVFQVIANTAPSVGLAAAPARSSEQASNTAIRPGHGGPQALAATTAVTAAATGTATLTPTVTLTLTPIPSETGSALPATPTSAPSAPATASATPSPTPMSSPTTSAPSPTAAPSPTVPISGALSPSVLAAPLAFERNVGQSDPSVAYLSHGPGYTLWLRATDATLAEVQAPDGTDSVLTSTDTTTATAPPPAALAPAAPLSASLEDVVRLRYVGANAAAPLVGQQPQDGVANYLLGADPGAYLTGVPTVGQVTVQGLYPGIDLVYYGHQGRLEDDFDVAAGADPSVIKLAVDGVQGLNLDAQGNLLLQTALGALVQQAPAAYQIINGQRQSVAAAYALHGDGTVGFSLGAYDPSQPLVIDPVLGFSTYLGGSGADEARAIAVDSGGAAYVTGYTASANFPTTTGAYSPTSTLGSGAAYDVFVTKLNAKGATLAYSTYLGGSTALGSSGDNEGHGIAVDAKGDAYVAGFTTASDFPTTTNAYLRNKPSGVAYDSAFVSELNPSGSALLYSTYYGGTKNDWAYGIAVDNTGGAYVTGATTSIDDLTRNAVQPNKGSTGNNTNVILLKLDTTKSGDASLAFETYLGGTQGDYGYGITLDSAGYVYIAGGAASTDGTLYDASHKTNCLSKYNSNLNDVFVTKINPFANPVSVEYNAFLGGDNNDFGYAVAVDAAGNAYVTGRVSSSTFPVTNAHEANKHGPYETFVAKLAEQYPGCAVLVYSDIVGGSGDDEGYGLGMDAAGDAIMTGLTTSSDYPTTANALQATYGGGSSDAFVTALDPTGANLLYSSYLGGSGMDYATALALDAGGNIYVTDDTTSTDFITTTGSYSPSLAGGEDAFVTKLGVPASGSVPWHPRQSIGLGLGGNLSLSVDLADGHADLHAAAMYIPGRGPDLEAGLTWDSTLARQGVTTAAGPGWVSNLTPGLGGVVTGTVVYTASDGTTWPFVYTGPYTLSLPCMCYHTPPGFPWQLTATTSGYSLTNVLSSETLSFDLSGRELADADAYQNQNTLSYTGTADLPTVETNSGGRALHAGYSGAGQITYVQSPLAYSSGGTQGQTVAYGYSGGQLTSAAWGYGTADQTGATFGYSGTQIVTVTTGIQGSYPGQTWLLGYDGQGRVSDVLSPVSGTLGQAGYTPAYTTLFLYSQGQTTLVKGYNAPGQLLTTDVLDGAGEPVAVVDGLGHTSYTFYDANHNVTYSQDPNGNATTNYYQYVGPNGSTGLITETVQPPIQPYSPLNGGMDQPTTRHFYNATTNDLTETDLPEGGKELYGYDGHHSVVTSTELLNSTTSQWRGTLNNYDGYGELNAVTDGRGVNVNSSGVASLAGNASQYTQHTTYTTQGDVQTQSSAPITTTLNGTVQVNTPVTTTYGYNADGNQTGQISPNGALSGEGYDHLGRLVTTSQPQVTLYNGQNDYPTQTTQYDSNGNVAQQTDGAGDVTLDSYDPMQRLVAETNPISGTTVYTYNATEQTAVRDPAGNPTSYQYDAAGRLITETAPLTGTTLFQYDPAGNTTAITTQDTNTGTPVQVEQQGYDSLDRVLTDTISGPSQPPTTTLTRYDHNGNVFQVQQPNGDVTVNTYDLADQLTSTQLYMAPISGPSGATGPSYDAYSYDPAGNQTDHYDADGRHTTTLYDGDNRVTQSLDVTTTGAITTTPQYDPDSNVLTQTMQTVDLTQPGVQQTHTLTSAYNAADWLMSTGDDGLVSSYQYDAAGQQRSETILNGQAPVTTVLDPEGRATAIGENLGGTGPYSSTFGYNQDDLPLTVTLHSDTPAKQAQQTAQYDRNSELTHLTASGPSGVSNPLNSSYDYAYNAAGWTTAMTWTVNGAVTATQIGHNALGRVTSRTGQIHGPESWAYDGNGNIISNSEFISDAIRTTAFTYDATLPNQLDQQQTQELGVEYFTYDQHGDTTSLTSTDPATYPNGQLDPYHVNIHVGYDAQQRPLTITTLMDGAPITATLAYNADGLRSRYTVISGTTTLRDEHFQYQDDELTQDAVVSGTQSYTDTFLYNQDGLPLELIRQQSGTTSRYWYVLDGQDNVVALVDANGNVVDRYAYDLWGEGLPEGTSETVRQPLRYGGYWWDQEVGWYWVNVRYYDPEGRWLQPDPSEIDGIHNYIYVNDDPVDGSDPAGMPGSIGPTAVAGCSSSGPERTYWAAHGYCSNGSVSPAAQAAYNFLIGNDIKTLRTQCSGLGCVAGKARAVIDLVTLFAPVAKVIKLGELAVRAAGPVAKLVKVVGSAARAHLNEQVIDTAVQLAKKGRNLLQRVGCAGCFAAGTFVATPHGAQAIQTLHKGQLVLAENPAIGKVDVEPVQVVIEDPTSPLVAVQLSDGSAITVTADHPFWVDGGVLLAGAGWLEAGQLRPGDRLRMGDGRDVLVVRLRRNVGYARVYTLTVAKDHSFFVGAAGVLVHNSSGCDPFPNRMPNDLATELAQARRLGVRPLRVGEEAFDQAINEGTVKWVVTEQGELLFEPKFVGGEEIAHTALTNGEPVLAAGEADIAGRNGHYVLLDISNHSGHYEPSAASLDIGRQAFAMAGIH